MIKDTYTFQDLIDIIALLRSEKGCPWDREQTHKSLKKNLIEETYEVIEALDSGNCKNFSEELGDLLLQIVFHSQIGKESGTFDIDTVINMICNKMINRHPHVFGEVKAETSEEVLVNWEEIKKKEKNLCSHSQVLREVSSYLPALMRSYKVQEKAAKVGFDWDDVTGAIDKVHEEIKEIEDVYESGDLEKIEGEVGDLLFAVVNVARFLNIHPEVALTSTIEKFINRFEYIEKKSIKNSINMEEMTLNEMEKLWEEAKTLNI